MADFPFKREPEKDRDHDWICSTYIAKDIPRLSFICLLDVDAIDIFPVLELGFTRLGEG